MSINRTSGTEPHEKRDRLLWLFVVKLFHLLFVFALRIINEMTALLDNDLLATGASGCAEGRYVISLMFLTSAPRPAVEPKASLFAKD